MESGEWRVESGEWRIESGDPIAIGLLLFCVLLPTRDVVCHCEHGVAISLLPR